MAAQAPAFIQTPAGLPDKIILPGGAIIALDRLPEEPLKFAALPTYRDAYGLDPAQYQENDQVATFDPRILQQIQNGCVGHGGCTALELAFLQAGVDLPPGGLSPTFLYALLNGGRDRGAMIGDLADAYTNTGNATAATYPEGEYFTWTKDFAAGKAEAENWRADEVYSVSGWEEAAAASGRGLSLAYSVMVGNGFVRVGANGIPGVDGGPGNHCIAGGGLVKVGGEWVIPSQNSWGKTYGRQGRMYITRQHVEAQGSYFSAVAIKSVRRVKGAPVAA